MNADYGPGGIRNVARLPSAAANVNATSVKATKGRVYAIQGYNAAAAVRYLKLYNGAVAPVVGTDVPFKTLALAPSAPFVFSWGDLGLFMDQGIGYGMTTGAADGSTAALTAADVVGLNIDYA